MLRFQLDTHKLTHGGSVSIHFILAAAIGPPTDSWMAHTYTLLLENTMNVEPWSITGTTVYCGAISPKYWTRRFKGDAGSLELSGNMKPATFSRSHLTPLCNQGLVFVCFAAFTETSMPCHGKSLARRTTCDAIQLALIEHLLTHLLVMDAFGFEHHLVTLNMHIVGQLHHIGIVVRGKRTVLLGEPVGRGFDIIGKSVMDVQVKKLTKP